ncbi:MAG: M20/M25/M40 family metallo-hydrolase [Dehalococcoidales bacterium]|nr:M20/M25/M40 family metallo-hydrolase [Dehalococcoidales bacterium]
MGNKKEIHSDLPAVENVLSDLIKIESVNPPGGETRVAGYLKKLFDRYQIHNEIIEPEPGRASFIADIGGGNKKLLYLSHTDVVPVTDGWDFPPFSGGIRDGFVHGRGAIDCKGLVAAEACAMIRLAQTAKLNGKLIFAATADEEVGGYVGAGVLSRKYPEKIRADFVVNEGAESLTLGDKTYHSISVGEKGPAWMKLTTKGISSHGSVPIAGNNAVVKMAEVVNKLAKYQPRIVLTPETKKLVQTFVRLDGLTDKVDESNLDAVLNKLSDKTLVYYLKAITRMTISPDVIRGGIKTNIVPDNCETEVDVRILPGQDWDYVMKELKGILNGVSVEPIQYSSASLSSSDNDYYRLIETTLKEFLGDVTILPSICTGATDSRYLRELGVPSYGIGVMTLNTDPALSSSVHGRNEKIDIASLRLKTDFLVRLAWKYLGD